MYPFSVRDYRINTVVFWESGTVPMGDGTDRAFLGIDWMVFSRKGTYMYHNWLLHTELTENGAWAEGEPC